MPRFQFFRVFFVLVAAGATLAPAAPPLVPLPEDGPLVRSVRPGLTPESSGQVRTPDVAALGGDLVRRSSPYQPIAFCPVPPEGDPLHVWVRYRGLALQAKRVVDGKQQELPWNWDRQDAAIAWRREGVYKRSDLGTGVLYIHAPEPAANGGLDAILITGDPAIRPDGSAQPIGIANVDDATVRLASPPPEETATPGEVTLTADWSAPGAPLTPGIFSLNSFIGFDPARTGKPAYARGFAYLGAKVVRYHAAPMFGDASSSQGWWDVAKNDWAYEKILAALRAWTPEPGVQRLINIANWPSVWDADNDGRLDPDHLAAYAAACARLARFVNVENKLGVAYWEITNERDGAYWVDPGRRGQDYLDELVTLYLTVARAVRASDPGAKIGGPAAMRPDYHAQLARFIRGAGPELDFFSFHAYASGELSESDQSIYNKTTVFAEHARKFAEILRTEIPGRRVELHLNEWNISWTWETREPRMINHKGAVFDALALIEFSRVPGLDVTNAWNECDGIYGKMDNDYVLRPSAYVFHHFNAFQPARVAAAESSAPARVVAWAALAADGRRVLVLVNRVNAAQTVRPLEALAATLDSGWTVARTDLNGYQGEAPCTADALILPSHSVTFLQESAVPVPAKK